MYSIPEDKLDAFMREAENVTNQLISRKIVDKTDLLHFGMAMNAVQTEIVYNREPELRQQSQKNFGTLR